MKNGQNTIRVRKDLILELQGWFDVLNNEWGAICNSASDPLAGEDGSPGDRSPDEDLETTEEKYLRMLQAFEDSKEAVSKIENIFQEVCRYTIPFYS